MAEQPQKPPFEYVYQLIADAGLSFGFIEGTGLGAVLLAIVMVFLICSRSFSKTSLTALVRAWRR